MSSDIRAFLKAADRNQFLVGTKANYHGLKTRVIAEYGSWDDAKGKKNLLSTLAIPQILDVASADSGFLVWMNSPKRELHGVGWLRIIQ